MKKLITLLLLFVGMVSTVSATDYVTIRIYALRETDWGMNVYIYANYWDGSKDVLIKDQAMTWITEATTGKHMFFVDLQMDKSLYEDAISRSGIKIKFNNGDKWTSNYTEIKDFSHNYIFYIKKGGDYYQENGTFDYKFAKYANSTLSDAVTLSPTNDVLTTTVDNEASVTETTYVLYPSFATDFGTPLKWELAISPNSYGDYWVNNFMVYSDALVHGVSSNRGFLVKDVLAKNKFTFNLSTMNFTVEPYRTATIGDAGYLTYSNGEKFTVSGADAYTAKDMGTYAKLFAIDGSTVFPANTGLLLRGSGEVTINAVASDASTDTYTSNYDSNNNLIGSGNSSASISAGCFVLY